MSRLRHWLPRLFLTWQGRWLLVQAVQPPEWALGPVLVTPNPPRLTEAWSSQASDPAPKWPHALTPLAEAVGFNYLMSLSPVQMLAPPHQELTETEVPYPDTDSAYHIYCHPKPSVGHLSPPLYLFTTVKSSNWPTGPYPVLQSIRPKNSFLHWSVVALAYLFYLLKGFFRFLLHKRSSGESESQRDMYRPLNATRKENMAHKLHDRESSEEDISPSQQKAQTRNPELTEEAESFPQEGPAQHPQTPEEVESFSPQAEAQTQHPEPTEEVEPPPLQQEAPSQPSEAPEELETPSPQEALTRPLETLKELVVRSVAHHGVNEAQQSNLYNFTIKPMDLALTITPQVTKCEPSLLHQDAPTQAPGLPTEYVHEIPVSEEVASLPGVQRHAHSNLPSVTLQPLDLELTITPEPTTEAEFPTAQQEALTPPLEHPEGTESSPTQQETSAKPPEPPGEVEPSREQEQPAQRSEPPGEVEPSPTQQEPTGQPPGPLVEAEPSASEQDQPTQPSEPTEPPEEVKTATQQDIPAQLSESFGEPETSATKEEASAQYPETPNEAESSATQQEIPALSPAEIETSAALQEQPAQPPEPSSGEVEPSLTQQEQPAQPPEHHEMTGSPPSHPHAHHSDLSSVTVKHADVELTITKEPTPEAGPSPNQRKPSAQPSVPLTNAEFSTMQHEAPTLPSQPPEEVELLPVQQEAPAEL
ncbi:LOW QUALITY PROTEIN: leucine-rich repeat-containing protein 37B-like [Tursiops truncatus]|uniref:LOW QUALITY PROTEIN: leucine-rich repeat-containing protein 37B-like n=1 Tax=Tursiops truncatus TaxID=9739 RepID=UPI003CCF0620